jgi:hypothetical protein
MQAQAAVYAIHMIARRSISEATEIALSKAERREVSGGHN